MKVGIYNSSRENFATGNTSAAVLTTEMIKKFDVELVLNSGSATKEELAQLSGRSLDRVAVRTVDAPRLIVSDPVEPARRFELIRKWSEELTGPYDLFINFADRWPIFCSAPQGVLVIQSPHDFLPSVYRTFWAEHLASYQLKLAYSYYTRFWTRIFWDVECPVIYPPVPFQPSSPSAKENLITIVGSIDWAHHQVELIDAFKELDQDLPAWSLVVMGELDQRRANKNYCATLKNVAGDLPVSIVTNPSATQKLEILRRSKIVWYAGGIEKDLELHPQRPESFNFDVVQAMAAGNVPLAANSGSLAEVIRHRESGLFCDTIADFAEHTRTLVSEETLRQLLSKSAQKRSQAFSAEQFTDAFLRELKDAFGIRSGSLASPSRLWKRIVRSADQLFAARR